MYKDPKVGLLSLLTSERLKYDGAERREPSNYKGGIMGIEDVKGKFKEAQGAVTDDSAKKKEGQAQQRKAEAEKDSKAEAEKRKARAAEGKDKGLLGGGGLL
jgi:uncharacterized protein YjbJ (UPF0337 family)